MKITVFTVLFPLLLLLMISTTLVFADTRNVHDLLVTGNNQLTLDNFTGAITYFDKVLKIEPNNTIALDSKGVALGNLKEYNEAITYFDKVLKINPNDTNAIDNKAAALIKLGKFNEAMININQALKIDPHDLVALSNKKVALNQNNISFRSGGTGFLEIFCQIEVRNSNNNLVAYLEPPDLYVYNVDLLNAILDTQSTGNETVGLGHMSVEKSNFTKNGKEFEKTNIVIISPHTSLNPETFVTQTGVLQGKTWIFWGNHDGYQLLPSDRVIQKWEIIRPVL